MTRLPQRLRRPRTASTATTAEEATTSTLQLTDDAGRLHDEAARARVGEYYEEHGGTIERICRALLRDPEEAADARQQTFLSAHRALLAGTAARDPIAWLATIARNECLQRIRARMRTPLAVESLELADDRADVHAQATARMDAAMLWTEIERLPAQQREAFILREFAGLSYEELAVALGVSDAAVDSLLFRARTRLRRTLHSIAASVNVAGFGSRGADLVARLFGSGGTPGVGPSSLAAKAVATTVGVVAIGGTGVATQLHQAHSHARPTRDPIVQSTAASPPVASREVSTRPAVSSSGALAMVSSTPSTDGDRGHDATTGGDGSSSSGGEDTPAIAGTNGDGSGEGSGSDGSQSTGGETATPIAPSDQFSTEGSSDGSSGGSDGHGGGDSPDSSD